MKFNKKKWTWIFALLLVVSWSSVQAVNHYVLGYDSVDDGEIRYTVDFDHSGYYNDFNYAKNKWNNYSDAVKILPDAWNTVNDLNIYEINSDADDDRFYGWYTYYWFWGMTDTIEINHYWTIEDELSVDERRNTMLHELGHALGLDHSYTDFDNDQVNVMHDYLTTILGKQDKSDCDYLWK